LTARANLDRLVGWSPVLMLAALGAFTYWLDAQVQPPPPRNDGSARHDPDVFLEHFRAITFDAQGKPRESLAADRADHFPDDQTSEVDKPQLLLTEPGKPTVTLTADRAKLSADREHAYFSGNVRVHRDPDPGNGGAGAGARNDSGEVTLTTTYLHVVPKRSFAQTDKPVTIEEPRGIIRGTGMELDLDRRTVRLGSRVSGTFQPQVAPSK
jgi:lipopolysaccharide export system protein LptC